jgi:hypothetical protein
VIAPAGVPVLFRLTLARALAWSLLLAGWVGLGSIAMALASSVTEAFALIALWLFALGVAAGVATHDHLRAAVRRRALVASGLVTAAALAHASAGGGAPALLVALLAWASLTALASGVVRHLRRLSLPGSGPPSPPVAAASLGALCAGLVVADISDTAALSLRLSVLVVGAAAVLSVLQLRDPEQAEASHCRAGLFDCSLPAWPTGAWHDPLQWPTLLAGLVMLPMMATLPLMASWCEAQHLPARAMVLAHFAAMFLPALLLRPMLAGWSLAVLSGYCTSALVLGSLAALWLRPPYGLFALALLHGSAWGLAWAGQLWAPRRRSQKGTSPLTAGLGYALLTAAFGIVVAQRGLAGVTATHALFGLAASIAWLWGHFLPERAADPPVTRVATTQVGAGPGRSGS